MQTIPLLSGMAAFSMAIMPTAATAGEKSSRHVSSAVARSIYKMHGLDRYRSHHGQKRFPPGLVDKCRDGDHPGWRGLRRACENQSRGAN